MIRGDFNTLLSRKAERKVLVTQSCLTLCKSMDFSPPSLSVHGILKARILKWVAFPSPRDLPSTGTEPGSPTLQADSLLSEPPTKPVISIVSTIQISVLRMSILGGLERRLGQEVDDSD